MKNLILLLCCCTLHLNAQAQTYITPSIGYDFLSMKSVEIDPGFYLFEVLSAPYSVKGTQIGGEIKQVVYKRFSISAAVNFSQRRVDAVRFGFFASDGFKFDYLRGNLALNCHIFNGVSVGIGYDYNQMKKLTSVLREISFPETFRSLMIDHGFHASIRGYWKNIEIKGYFHKGINDNIGDSALDLSIEPIDYVGFSLGYRINVIKLFKKKKKRG